VRGSGAGGDITRGHRRRSDKSGVGVLREGEEEAVLEEQ